MVMGFDTTITFRYQGEVYSTGWRGELQEHVEFLPDTPATYILFDKQGRS